MADLGRQIAVTSGAYVFAAQKRVGQMVEIESTAGNVSGLRVFYTSSEDEEPSVDTAYTTELNEFDNHRVDERITGYIWLRMAAGAGNAQVTVGS